jgi:hypothetical protein
MSIKAPHVPTHAREDQPTIGLNPSLSELILDALPLLDHRTRMRAVSPKHAPPGHYLELEHGEQRMYVPLEERITHIGRGFTADLRLEQAHVSVSHAILVRHGRHLRVLDNRSSNGTFVNGRQIVATNINDGDVLRVGPVVMRYVVVS